MRVDSADDNDIVVWPSDSGHQKEYRIASVMNPKESAARASIEARRGKPYSDAEWEEAKGNLLALARLLAEANHRPHGADAKAATGRKK